MARFKTCVCGKKSLAARRDLCKDCLGKYGTNKDEWPDWLKFAVKDTQRAHDYDRKHDDLEIWDSQLPADEEDEAEYYEDDEVVADDEIGILTAEDAEQPAGIGAEKTATLEAALATLQDDQAQAIILQANGYTVREIADQMGVSRSTVQRLVTAAKAKLAFFGTTIPLISGRMTNDNQE